MTELLPSSRLVFPVEFVDGYGCHGPSTDAYLLLQRPLDRAALEELRDSLAALVAASAASLPPVLLLPEPRWDASYAGTRGEFRSEHASWLAERRRLGDERERLLASDRVRVLSAAGALPFVPVGWYPVHVGDEDEASPAELLRPRALVAALERGCRCAHSGFWGDDSPDVLAVGASLVSALGRSFLVPCSLAGERLASLVSALASAEARVAEEAAAYALERAEFEAFVPLSQAELDLFTFEELGAYEAATERFQRWRLGHLSREPAAFHAARLAAAFEALGAFEVRLGVLPR